jgi:hypothetical protein
MNKATPTRANVIVLKQILNLIPRHLIGRHVRETGVDAKARAFSVTSHPAAMLFAQLSYANKERDALFVEKLFWSTLGHLQHA